MVNENKISTQRDRITFWLITLSCVCLIVQLYAMPREISSLMSLSNRLLLILWLGVGSVCILKEIAQGFSSDMASFMWLLVFVAFAFLCSVLSAAGAIVRNITSLFNFIVFPVMLLYSVYFGVPKKAKTVILLSNVALSVVFIDLYNSNYRNYFRGSYSIVDLNSVTLGYSNPNQSAMFLFVCALLLFVSIFYFSKKIVKLALVADMAYICKMLYETESRTALMVLIVFALLWLLSRKFRVTKTWITVTLLVPLVYAIAALFFLDTLADVKVWGEDLFNGREDIFKSFMNNLNIFTFVFGDYARFSFENLHNSYISIAATAGVFSAICFALLLNKFMVRNLEVACEEKYKKIAFIAFLCVTLYSSSEAAFFVGGSTYAFMVFAIFLLFCRPFLAEE